MKKSKESIAEYEARFMRNYTPAVARRFTEEEAAEIFLAGLQSRYLHMIRMTRIVPKSITEAMTALRDVLGGDYHEADPMQETEAEKWPEDRRKAWEKAREAVRPSYHPKGGEGRPAPDAVKPALPERFVSLRTP